MSNPDLYCRLCNIHSASEPCLFSLELAGTGELFKPTYHFPFESLPSIQLALAMESSPLCKVASPLPSPALFCLLTLLEY